MENKQYYCILLSNYRPPVPLGERQIKLYTGEGRQDGNVADTHKIQALTKEGTYYNDIISIKQPLLHTTYFALSLIIIVHGLKMTLDDLRKEVVDMKRIVQKEEDNA